ncbi:MAG: hypothetical protein L0221_00360 [Chloroflexi bacterium]|nr:hypothetical protein [Chloroflexota bacterium]
MLIAIGSRMTWATVTLRSSPVSLPGFGRLTFRGGEVTAGGANIGVGYLSGLGLLIALVALGWLTAGPRTRMALSLLAFGAAIAGGILTLQARGERAGFWATGPVRELGGFVGDELRLWPPAEKPRP